MLFQCETFCLNVLENLTLHPTPQAERRVPAHKSTEKVKPSFSRRDFTDTCVHVIFSSSHVAQRVCTGSV